MMARGRGRNRVTDSGSRKREISGEENKAQIKHHARQYNLERKKRQNRINRCAAMKKRRVSEARQRTGAWIYRDERTVIRGCARLEKTRSAGWNIVMGVRKVRVIHIRTRKVQAPRSAKTDKPQILYLSCDEAEEEK
ncbi:hypothetical protein VTN00DRAFT_5811 [Thermoascus crustaceus]|uniref:uncharacterized protein n=1 Tax=Thermoascus crustaceus TaxID=5088 RepID=UPI0037441F59